MPNVQNFYHVSHAIEDLVGITDDKYYPHIGIIRPITAVWMVLSWATAPRMLAATLLAPPADRSLKYSIIRSLSEKAAGV
jgi:hypothetical protein